MNLNKQRMFLFFSKILSAGITFLSFIILSRVLTLEEYGGYKQVLMFNQIISSFLILGLPIGVLYFLSVPLKERQKNITNLIALKGVFLFIMLLIVYPLIIIFSIFLKNEILLNNSLSIIIILLCQIVISDLENILIAEKMQGTLIKNTLIINTAYICLLISGIYLRGNISFFLKILALRGVIGLLIYFYIIKLKIKYKFYKKLVKLKEIKKILFFIIPLGLSTIIGAITVNIDKLLVAHFFTTQDLALISNAGYELPFLSLIGSSVFGVMLPTIKAKHREGKNQEIATLWRETGVWMSFIMVPLGIVMYIFAKEIIIILYSERYINGVEIFRIYQLQIIFRIFLYGTIFTSLGRGKKLLFNILVSIVLNTGLNLFLMRYFGLIGVAYATFITLVVLVILQNYQIKKILSQKINKIYPIKEWIQTILISIFLVKIGFKLFIDEETNLVIGVTVLKILVTYVVAVLFTSILIRRKKIKSLIEKKRKKGANYEKNN